MSVDAKGLLKGILDFQFVLGLQILKVIFSNTNALAHYLQEEDIDVMTARPICQGIIETLKKCRDDESFDIIWGTTYKKVQKLKNSIEESEVQYISIALHRNLQPSRRLQTISGKSSDTEQFVEDKERAKIDIYFCSMDRVVRELERRFDKEVTSILASLGDIVMGVELASDESFKVVANHYGIDLDILKDETNIYNEIVHDNAVSRPAQVVHDFISNSLNSALPHFFKVAQILSTIPTTSCTAETSFSCLRRLKIYLRSTMGQLRLSNLALIHIERALANQINIESVIDRFGRRPGRSKHFF